MLSCTQSRVQSTHPTHRSINRDVLNTIQKHPQSPTFIKIAIVAVLLHKKRMVLCIQIARNILVTVAKYQLRCIIAVQKLHLHLGSHSLWDDMHSVATLTWIQSQMAGGLFFINSSCHRNVATWHSQGCKCATPAKAATKHELLCVVQEVWCLENHLRMVHSRNSRFSGLGGGGVIAASKFYKINFFFFMKKLKYISQNVQFLVTWKILDQQNRSVQCFGRNVINVLSRQTTPPPTFSKPDP